MVATFDPETGRLREMRSFDLFPADATAMELHGAAGQEDATFAESYVWSGGANPSWGKLMIGNADDPGVRFEVDLKRPEPWRGVTDVTWDGEAFAVHAWDDNIHRQLFVARVSPSGQLLLPLAVYGQSPQGGFGEPEEKLGGYTVATSANTGRSFHFDPRSGRLVNAHERAGAPVPWAPKNIEVLGRRGSGNFAGSATDDVDGVWFAWQDRNDMGTDFVGRAIHLSGNGEAGTMFSFQSLPDDPFAPSAPIRARPALVPRGSAGVRIFATSWYRIYLFDHDGRDLTGPRVLFRTGRSTPCPPAGSPSGA
jgi:hypothetical protein